MKLCIIYGQVQVQNVGFSAMKSIHRTEQQLL